MEGETIMTVVPEGENRILARVSLSVKGSGKVKAGMPVNIKLNGYPYLEYGMLQGIVASKSLAATEDGYLVDVDLPDSLVTFYGKELEFSQKMPGTAEIITEDMRLLERIVYTFRYIIEKNRRD
jgi:HlyD family secretion protein